MKVRVKFTIFFLELRNSLAFAEEKEREREREKRAVKEKILCNMKTLISRQFMPSKTRLNDSYPLKANPKPELTMFFHFAT